MTLRPSTTVYSWYTPEVAELLAPMEYPTETFQSNFDPGLDELHWPLMHRYLHSSASTVIDNIDALGDYHGYYVNGSSEALYHLLARHKTYFPNAPLYQHRGEYQGYGEYAKALGMTIQNVDYGTDPLTLPPGVWMISTPSAVDGNTVPKSWIERIGQKHFIILDLAYAGMQPETNELLEISTHVAAVVGSLSKPFGLYYHRIGFVWARDPIDSLYGNKWFKNAYSITVGETVLDRYRASDLAKLYRRWQDLACIEASQELGVEVIPSDVWLLGHTPYTGFEPESLNEFKRGISYRYCLTPYFMEYAKHA